MSRVFASGHVLSSGIVASVVVAASAALLAEHFQTPAMLLPFLLGMAMGVLADVDSRCKPGIEFTSRKVLRLGVALLGYLRWSR